MQLGLMLYSWYMESGTIQSVIFIRLYYLRHTVLDRERNSISCLGPKDEVFREGGSVTGHNCNTGALIRMFACCTTSEIKIANTSLDWFGLAADRLSIHPFNSQSS